MGRVDVQEAIYQYTQILFLSQGSAQAGPLPGGIESRSALPPKRLLPLSIRAATAVHLPHPHPSWDEKAHEGTPYASPIHLITPDM